MDSQLKFTCIPKMDPRARRIKPSNYIRKRKYTSL